MGKDYDRIIKENIEAADPAAYGEDHRPSTSKTWKIFLVTCTWLWSTGLTLAELLQRRDMISFTYRTYSSG